MAPEARWNDWGDATERFKPPTAARAMELRRVMWNLITPCSSAEPR